MVYFAYGFPSTYRLESEDLERKEETAGGPYHDSEASTTHVVCMRWSEKVNEDVVVVVTVRNVQVWSGGQSRVRLGESGDQHVLHDDKIMLAACCGKMSRVAVVTEKGILMVFEYRAGDVMEWTMDLDSPLNAYDIVPVHQESLVQDDGTSEDGVVNICGDDNVFAVVFPSGDFQTYDWLGRLIHRHSPLENTNLALYLKEFGVHAMSSIVCVDYSAHAGLVGIGFDNGIVLVVKTVLGESMMGEHAGQHDLYKVVYAPKKREIGGACTVSFHPKGRYLAVGLHAADVVLVNLAHVFEMKGESDSLAQGVDNASDHIYAEVGLESRVLSLTAWGHRPKELGDVSSLAWSPDGEVLAVGNRKKGLTVWTTRGCRLLCTIPTAYRDNALLGAFSPRLLEPSFSSSPSVQVQRIESKESQHGMNSNNVDDIDANKVGAIGDNGVLDMVWSKDGGHLLVHECASSVMHDLTFAHCCNSHIIRTSNAPFCRNSMTTLYSREANFFLIGSDRLLLVMPSTQVSEPAKKDGERDIPDLMVQHVRVPQQYLETGFPLKLASLNPSGTDLVVSGSQGACVYHVIQEKWRVFGDVTQDKAIHAWHLGWVHDDVLVICATVQGARNTTLPNAKVALYYFPKNYLDASSLLGFIELDEVPALFDCSNNRLTLVYKSGKVQIFNHQVGGAGNQHSTVQHLNVKVQYEFQTPEQLNGPIQSITVMRKSINNGLWCIMVSESGHLGCLDLGTSKYRHLAEDVDYFWVPQVCEEERKGVLARNIELPWWTYGKNGMKLWFDTQMFDSGGDFADGDPELDFDLEVLPIGVSLEEVSIVGLMNRIHRKYAYFSGGLSTEFTPMPESQPVLACMLRRLLRKNRFKDALALADMYSHRPHFSRSLEWLLFTALDANEALQVKNSLNKNDAGSDLLKSAELLSHFPQSAELVVSVARKTEAELWPPLFQAAGSPIALSDNLLRDGALEHAACCLLIINEVFGQSEASLLALKILKSALSVSKYTLCADILRFLAPEQVLEAHEETDKPSVQSNSEKGYFGWLWQWVAPTESTSVDGNPIDTSEEKNNGIDTKIPSMEKMLHESWKLSSDDPKYLEPSIEAWRTLARQAWRLLDSGNIKELAVFGKAMRGLYGGLRALFETTRSLHPTSLGHTTPSSSMIASALFVASNEIASAQNELELIPDLMQSLLDSGNINYAIALAIVANEQDVTSKFCAENQKVWESLATLIANDVHLCAFTSVLQSAALPHALARTFTI